MKKSLLNTTQFGFYVKRSPGNCLMRWWEKISKILKPPQYKCCVAKCRISLWVLNFSTSSVCTKQVYFKEAAPLLYGNSRQNARGQARLCPHLLLRLGCRQVRSGGDMEGNDYMAMYTMNPLWVYDSQTLIVRPLIVRHPWDPTCFCMSYT